MSIITDPRPFYEFKDKTFSGFKKSEVINILLKSIEKGKPEDVCFWLTECIVSGYIIEIYHKLFIFSCKIVHVNSPNLPEYLYRKFLTFKKTYNHIDNKNRDKLIHLRNTQDVRSLLFDIAIVLTMTPKTRRYDKLPKIDPIKDFVFDNIKSKMNATMQLLPQNIIRFTDPDELRIIMNEIYFNLKNKNGGYDQVIYWINWLLHWEKKAKQEKRKYEIEEREINNVKPKYCKDIVWLIWEVIITETNERDEKLKKQIYSLCNYFKDDFTTGKRSSRMFVIYNAVGLLTLKLEWNTKIKVNKSLYITTQCNIDNLFKTKKANEVKTYTPPPEKEKKIKGELKEIINDRMKQLQELDQILF